MTKAPYTETVLLYRETCHETLKALMLGLTTDGEQHKQWALEKAFRLLCEDEYVDRAKAKFQWAEGVEP